MFIFGLGSSHFYTNRLYWVNSDLTQYTSWSSSSTAWTIAEAVAQMESR